MPPESTVIEQVDDGHVVVHVRFPGVAVAVYVVKPESGGASHEISADPLAALASNLVGGNGGLVPAILLTFPDG